MKNTIAAIFFTLWCIHICTAQNKEVFRPYVFVTASAGASLIQLLPDTVFGFPTSHTNVYDGTLQYKPSKNLSFGACFAYQKFVSTDTTIRTGGNATRIYYFINPGIMGAYNFPISKNLDFYLQAKLNYQIQYANIQYYDSSFSVNSVVKFPIQNQNLYNFQVAMGFNYYFAKNFGLHLEGAIGKPYLIKLGINYRVFTNASVNTKERKIERVEPLKGKSIYD